MKANETKVEDFLSANKTQFVIPVYQRNYDWTTSQCKQLLDDILEVGTNKTMNAHFIGSIVYVHDDVYTAARIKELTVIDGQQRLTTLTLIYLALYKLAKELKKDGLIDEINETYLINKFAPEELQQVLDKLNTFSSDFAEIKEDIKSIKQEINDIKTSQAVLVNDGKWIKILYGVFSSIIILLMGTLINIKS